MYLPGPMPLFKFINASAWANVLIQIYQCISLGQYQCLILSMYLPGPIPFLAPTGAQEDGKLDLRLSVCVCTLCIQAL